MSTPGFLNQRLVSLDVYRGLIMIALAFNGFGLAITAQRHLQAENYPLPTASAVGLLGGPMGTGPLLAVTSVAAHRKVESHSSFWQTVRYQFDHVQWVGCSFWDLIQPSFMFMVGVAMAFSYGKRLREGQSFSQMLGHAVVRSIVLIFLGIFLISNGRRDTLWSFVNVLTQIGLGYTFLFLLWNRPTWVQAAAAAFLLAGTWVLYATYPYAGIDLDTGQRRAVPSSDEKRDVGITHEWAEKNLTGVPDAWHKNANVGHAVDREILKVFYPNEPVRRPPPRGRRPAAVPDPRTDSGGYQTINFIPSLATMIFGLMAGELLRSSRSSRQKLLLLLGAGAAGLAVGQALNQTELIPLVKRIWTPSWTLFSTGWCLLILAALYGVVDVLGWRAWTYPLVVVGVNSIAIYCMSMLLRGWVAGSFRTHFGPRVFYVLGPLWEPTLQALVVGGLFWLVCLWMYHRKIFIRI